MGCFVVVDGLDGSGKGVILQAFKDWAGEKNLRILDLKEYTEQNNRLPQPEELDSYDAIFSREPTAALVGKAISEEIIKDNGRDYNVFSTAWAFALDREILYKRVIIPALKKDKYIFQERGVVTSLVYQPVQGRITFKQLIDLPGNRLALKYAPQVLIIPKVEPKVVLERLKSQGKLGSDIFSELNFQRKIDQRYSSDWLQKLFERFKTKVVYIDTNPPRTVEETKAAARKFWDEYLAKL